MPFNYKTYGDLARDVAAGLAKLPMVDIVVGIPKSGLIPAMMIASFLNREFVDLDSFLFRYGPRSGERRQHSAKAHASLRVLVVDDSVNSGREFGLVRTRLSHFGPEYDFTYCAVYGVRPGLHDGVVDVVLAYVEQPRFFQWNYRNHVIAEHALFDLDGVLCVDPTDEQNDDGERYLEFIANAQLLAAPKRKLSGIVTSRLEKYRAPTEDWLARNEISYGELLMLDLPSAAERRRLRAHAPFKAEVYRSRSEVLFVESNWKQAREIAKRSDKPVICTENDVLVYGASHLAEVEAKGVVFDLETVATIEELRRQNRALMLDLHNKDLAAGGVPLATAIPSFRDIRKFGGRIFGRRDR